MAEFILFRCIVFVGRAIAMQNNLSGQINFKVKTSSSETFFKYEWGIVYNVPKKLNI